MTRSTGELRTRRKREAGIEPASSVWKTVGLPLSYSLRYRARQLWPWDIERGL